MSGWGGDSEATGEEKKKGCFKCGEEGHMSRDCPTGGGGGEGGACRKCGKEGHFAKDCELPDKCFKCKQEGHKSADCELPDTCFKCKKEGHMAADCELPDTCRKCKKEGHMAKDCELPDVCRNCGEEGHMSKDCSKPQLCKRCGEEGHMVRECTQEEKTRQMTDEEGKIREIYVPKAEEDEGKLFENAITSGINFNKFENIPVKVTGENPPSAISSFSSAGLRPVLLENIQKSGYRVPTPVQKRCLPIVMSGRDLMSCAQTGSGKTAAFLLPVLHKLIEGQADNNAGEMVQTPQCVVITPTRELAMQMPGQELIDALKIAFIKGLKKYYESNHSWPDTVIVFRDGVGDGQLSVSAKYEAEQFKDCFKHISDDYSPGLGFVVVQKRINTRIFLMQGKECENPAPGTVLDHTVTKRDWYDFFLVSQHVGQGTVSPSHYIVIHDSSGLSPDMMQKLAYKLTHMYYNWPGTVRVPAPCQYAHKLAYQVGEHIHKEPSRKLEERLFYL